MDDDVDDDGLPNTWEVDHGLDPRDSADAATDLDEDGVSNLAEYQRGTAPDDYYNGTTPTITTLEGGSQSGPPGYFLPYPWTVQVRNSAGAILVNAPVIFDLGASAGYFSRTGDGTSPLEKRITVRTDYQGLAWVYWKL
jgi:hypothetical protein